MPTAVWCYQPVMLAKPGSMGMAVVSHRHHTVPSTAVRALGCSVEMALAPQPVEFVSILRLVKNSHLKITLFVFFS